MFKIIITLVNIRLRKLLPQGDITARFLFFSVSVFAFYLLDVKFDTFKDYILFFSFEILYYHLHRKDLELLYLHNKYKLILFLEYLIYSSPYLILFIINQKFLFALIYLLLLLVFVNLPRINILNILKYPFNFFDPFWHICFRKYKLILVIPLCVFLIYMGINHNNQNLIFSTLLFISLTASIPSFQRERIAYIKVSKYTGKKYIINHCRTSIINTSIIALPIFFMLVICQQWNILVFTPLIFILPLSSIFFKYSFFSHIFSHVLFFAIYVSQIPSGIIFFILPFLFYKAVKQIKTIQHVTN